MQEIEIISRENIRPSDPTPLRLKTYSLSMLDQIVPPLLVPIVYYFPNNNKTTNPNSFISRTNQLKRSLSLILTRFYPFAGRINPDHKSINCADQGVPFIVVKFSGLEKTLENILKNPGMEFPRFLLPCQITWDSEMSPDSSVCMVQTSCFNCGGIAIGAVFWHKLADATTIGSFFKSWAAANRASKEPICPNYISQSLFPFNEEIPTQSGSLSAILKRGKSVMRRYVFGSSAISSLREKTNVESPTRVELVSALIWKCFMEASLANNRKTSAVTHAVNLRRRANPPFPSDCFGNFPGLAAAWGGNEKIENLGDLVGKMREAISKIDGEFVSRMIGDGGFSGHHENLGRVWSEIPEDADLLSISSWCSFGFYETDFGWGNPVWLTRCDTGSDSESKFINVVWLMDTRFGNGIEAWVTLDEKYMSIFDNVEELRSFASKDPNPLDVSALVVQSNELS